MGKNEKIIILIPVYNDWESLKKLLLEINENIKAIQNISFNCFVVNDSSTIRQPELKKPPNISSLKILNMKKMRDTQDVTRSVSNILLNMKVLIILC